MTPFLRPLAAATILALAAAGPVQAQGFSTEQRGEIERVIKEYLMKHPEVLQEAINELEKRQAQEQVEKAKTAIKTHREQLYSSTRQVTLGNPQGDVTFVEFFDYNCGYYKPALSDMIDLM